MAAKPKKKTTVTYLSTWDKVKNWWETHHTTRKGIETAIFVCVSGVATALLQDPALLENPSTVSVGLLIIALRMVDNWAKHNVEAYGGEKAKKD